MVPKRGGGLIGIAGLDLAVTATCSARAHLLPKYARKEAGLYEADTLSASNKVTLAQARLALKLKRDPNPIRKALIEEMGGPKPAPKSGLQWHRALTALRSAGVSLHPGVPPPSKAKTRRVLGIVEQSLHAEQCRSLTSALPLQPRAGSQGRGSAHLFNQVICPMQGKYNEWRKLGSIPNPTHRKSIRKLRLGQVLCATERVKWGEDLGPSPLTCSCGAPVEDPYHVIMECPHTAPARCAVLDSIRVAAQSDPQVKHLVQGQSDLSVLKATLGAQIGPWKGVGAGPYNTIMDLARPIWSRELKAYL